MLTQLTWQTDADHMRIAGHQMDHPPRNRLRIAPHVPQRPWNGLVILGSDPLVRQLMRAAGFDELDYFATRFVLPGHRATAIVLPAHVWTDEDARRTVLAVKRQAASVRTRCIVAPLGFIARATRGPGTRAMATAGHIPTDADLEEMADGGRSIDGRSPDPEIEFRAALQNARECPGVWGSAEVSSFVGATRSRIRTG